MTAKLIDVELRLPRETLEELEAVAKLSGLKPEQVARVLLALFIRREGKQGQNPVHERISP